MQTTILIQELSKLSILFTMFCFLFIIVNRKMVIPKYIDFLLGISILCGTGLLLSKTTTVSFAELFFQMCVATLVGSFTLHKYKCELKRCRLRENTIKNK